jgi:hypothetical protein
MFSTGDRTPLLIAIGVIAAILIVVLAIVIRQSGDSGAYPDSVRNDFVDACVNRPGGTESKCQCIYDRLAADVPYDDFEAFDQLARENPDIEQPPWLVEAIDACPA